MRVSRFEYAESTFLLYKDLFLGRQHKDLATAAAAASFIPPGRGWIIKGFRNRFPHLSQFEDYLK